MDKREQMIRLWFSMWLEKKDLGMDDIFAENVSYTESWGPCYSNRETVKHWFQEWNMRGSVIAWDIKQFFHKDNQTIVEWYFKNQMDGGHHTASCQTRPVHTLTPLDRKRNLPL